MRKSQGCRSYRGYEDGGSKLQREKLSHNDAGMIIVPAEATTRNLVCSWDTAAAELLQILASDYFHFWKSTSLWTCFEKSPDGWHAAYHADNIRLVARHLARAADYIIGLLLVPSAW
jgi:hypothetical protein